MTLEVPSLRPANPHFSSGPCTKHPQWTLQSLEQAHLGSSHRSKAGRAKLKSALDLTREILQIPANYRVAIVPGSDTGAMELALWSLLGQRGIDLLSWDAFGEIWLADVVTHLKLSDTRVLRAPRGEIADLGSIDFNRDVIFTWNGTATGVRVPNGDWIASTRQGLTICDATSAAFAQKLDWPKLDAVTFSWQKALGGEGAHGMLVLSPRAVERLKTYVPPWPLPKLFRLMSDGVLNEDIFEGWTINTPSMLCVEDYLSALHWAKAMGGLEALVAKADANTKVLADWLARTPWAAFLARDEAVRSNTSVCLIFDDPLIAAMPEADQAHFTKMMLDLLETENIAFDIGGYRGAPGLRIWCGPTVEASNLQALTPWLDFAFETIKARFQTQP